MRKPRVLCVDDEPAVLQGLRLQLRRGFDVVLAEGPAAALGELERGPAPAVVVSDMRMPVMDGAELLRRAAALHPDATRVLLTGDADLSAAIRAINEGGVFRFLVKPCPPATLRTVITEAAELHRLKKVEEELLGRTLTGCVTALSEVLEMAEPRAFGVVRRVDELIQAALPYLEVDATWALEVANVFGQLPAITLPSETLERLYTGVPLNEAEAKMVDGQPRLAAQLSAHIPRLEAVTELIRDAASAQPRSVPGQLLRAARHFVELTSRGEAPEMAVSVLAGRPGLAPEVLGAIRRATCGDAEGHAEVREVPVGELRRGMVFAADVRDPQGRLLVARGQTLTDGMRRRLGNLAGRLVARSFLMEVSCESESAA